MWSVVSGYKVFEAWLYHIRLEAVVVSMVSGLDSRSSVLGWSPHRVHCVIFLEKTLYSHITSLHPGVKMDTREFNAWGNPVKV